jgi:histidine racemase
MLYTNKLTVINPGGNTTALLINPNFNLEDRRTIQSKIISKFPAVEQCGIVRYDEKSKIVYLEMFGGEVCFNAIRSTAFYLKNVIPNPIQVLCCGNLYNCNTINHTTSIEFTLPFNETLFKKVDEGYIVNLTDISHITSLHSPLQNIPFETQCKTLINKYNLSNLPAVGCSFVNKEGKVRFGVWVNSIDSFFDETACGSGTICIAIVNFIKSGLESKSESIIQPSLSEFKTKITKTDNLLNIKLSGEVSRDVIDIDESQLNELLNFS